MKKVNNKTIIFAEEFKTFYSEELYVQLKKLDQIRLSLLMLILLSALTGLSAFAYLIYLEVALYVEISNLTILLFVGFIFSSMPFILNYNYNKNMRKAIIETFFNFIGNYKKIDKIGLESQILSLHLFETFNDFKCINRYSGKYKLTNMEISEIFLGEKSSNTKRKIFEGLFIKIENKKKNQGYIIVRKHSLQQYIGIKVDFDNSEFSKYYDVYTDRRAEALQTVTNSFMERAVLLAKKGMGENFTISFENENIYIAIARKKRWFNVSVLQAVSHVENYRLFILELIALLKIIDSLNLDKKADL